MVMLSTTRNGTLTHLRSVNECSRTPDFPIVYCTSFRQLLSVYCSFPYAEVARCAFPARILCPTSPAQNWKHEQRATGNRSCHSIRHLLARICTQFGDKGSLSAIRHDASLLAPSRTRLPHYGTIVRQVKTSTARSSGRMICDTRSAGCYRPKKSSSSRQC
jgi:hypothetical protein